MTTEVTRVDLRPLQQAIRALRYTLPLEPDDLRYVARADALSTQIRSRMLAPSASRVLIAGTPGCGKSTELARIPRVLDDGRHTLLLRADRALDLLSPTMEALDRALLKEAGSVLDATWKRAFRRAGASAGQLFAKIDDFHAEDAAVTLQRLLDEEAETRGELVLIIDGLEKLPVSQLPFLDAVLARPEYRRTLRFVVVPHWRLYGWSSLRAMDDVEIVEVTINAASSFVADVLQLRAGEVIDREDIEAIGAYCGGVVRDGLQFSLNACRCAMERGAARVGHPDMIAAEVQLRNFFEGLFADQYAHVRSVLSTVDLSGEFPEITPELRSHLLAAGAVLRGVDRFVVHPAARAAT